MKENDADWRANIESELDSDIGIGLWKLNEENLVMSPMK